jgi:hypothetical protein
MNGARSKASNNRYSGHDATDYSFNQYAGGLKVVGPILGHVQVLGAANTLLRVEAGSLIALYNSTGTTAFAKIGDPATLTAPTGGADGVCLKPNDYTIISVGPNQGIIANVNTVFAYLIVDDLKYSSQAGIL